jgi:hypothetical protein
VASPPRRIDRIPRKNGQRELATGEGTNLLAAPIASALPTPPSQRELDARVELEVKAGLWDEARIMCVPHGAGVDKPVTEWLAERLAALTLPAATPKEKS